MRLLETKKGEVIRDITEPSEMTADHFDLTASAMIKALLKDAEIDGDFVEGGLCTLDQAAQYDGHEYWWMIRNGGDNCIKVFIDGLVDLRGAAMSTSKVETFSGDIPTPTPEDIFTPSINDWMQGLTTHLEAALARGEEDESAATYIIEIDGRPIEHGKAKCPTNLDITYCLPHEATRHTLKNALKIAHLFNRFSTQRAEVVSHYEATKLLLKQISVITSAWNA